jgi:hypothetical protein
VLLVNLICRLILEQTPDDTPDYINMFIDFNEIYNLIVSLSATYQSEYRSKYRLNERAVLLVLNKLEVMRTREAVPVRQAVQYCSEPIQLPPPPPTIVDERIVTPSQMKIDQNPQP